jgi:hypothetical protein
MTEGSRDDALQAMGDDATCPVAIVYFVLCDQLTTTLGPAFP